MKDNTSANNNLNPYNVNIEERKFNLKLFFFQYFRYWYLFLITIILSVIAARYYNWYTTPMYKATCKIIIKDNNFSSASDNLLKELNVPKDNKNIENEIQVLKSRTLVAKALERLSFDVSYVLVGKIKTMEMYKQSPVVLTYDSLDFLAYFVSLDLRINDSSTFDLSYTIQPKEKKFTKTYRFGEKIINPFGSFVINKREGIFDPEVYSNPEYDKRNIKIIFNSIENLTDVYSSVLDIEAPKGSSILFLSADDPVPEKAADFLDMIADVYIKNGIEQKNELSKNSLAFIDSQLKLVSKDLEGVEARIEAFKTSRGITDISLEATSFLDDVKKYDLEVSEMDVKLSFLDYLENYVKDDKLHSNSAPTSIGIADPLLQQLISRLSDLENELKKLDNTVNTDNNPLVSSLKNQIQNTKASLLENIKSIKDGMKISQRELEKKLALLEKNVKSIPKAERELIGIKRQFSMKESLYLFLLEKQSETSILLASTVSDNRVIDKARASYSPFKPVKSKSYAIAILFGILVPALFIYLKNLLNDKISDWGELQEKTQIPVLGVIGFNESERNIILGNETKSMLAESFRSIRTNLQYFNSGKSKSVILITSSIGTEGKTFCAVNLSIIFAISGKKTVLLGLDLRKPKIANDFGLNNEIGISSYLIGAADEQSIIQKSSLVPDLDIILSGPIPPNPSELIMSEKMDALFAYLKANYDYVIVDTPPIGLVTDGLLLTKYSDANIYVVRQNVTRVQHVEFINQLYKEGKIKNLSIMFNAFKVNNGRYGYYYDYGYGYGYGHGYGYGYYSEEKSQPKSIGKKLKDIVKKI